MSKNKLLSYETLVHALSGAAGGVTALSVFFPLDTVRSRLQVEEHRKSGNTFSVLQDLIKEEGLESLYRGLNPVLASLCCSNFVYFYSFHGLRTLVVSKNAAKNALRDLTVAGIAGVINVMVTTPLWVANTRLKMQGAKISAEDSRHLAKHPTYKGLIDAVLKIYSNEGVTALWSSIVPSLMLVINPAIQFAVYETLKLEYAKFLGRKDLGSLSVFFVAAVSKAVATVLTYPLQLVQSKLRYGSDKFKRMNIFEVFSEIIRTNGFTGLYKGLEAKILQTVLTAALMFLCYEKIAAFVFHIMRVKSH